MKKNNLTSWVYFAGFIGLLFAFYSFTTNAITSYADSNDEGEWENLKVLPEDISKDSLKHLMRGYNAALGVKCSYCHASSKEDPKKLDFANDSKDEKEFARSMIKMTQKINAENFNWDNHPEPEKINMVSCTMCHRGSPKPSKYLQNADFQYRAVEKEEK